ncbi:MAG: hypothetical protein ACU0FH_01995 [Heliomarina sp.]|uniref:hypothetical protein n=1 Tax=Heliomarina sp. TaxID=2917556 RepID=UPI00405994DD
MSASPHSPFPYRRHWRFQLGAVVTWIHSFQNDGKRRELGHVTGFAQDELKNAMVRVRWQDGRTEDVAPGYLRTEKD